MDGLRWLWLHVESETVESGGSLNHNSYWFSSQNYGASSATNLPVHGFHVCLQVHNYKRLPINEWSLSGGLLRPLLIFQRKRVKNLRGGQRHLVKLDRRVKFKCQRFNDLERLCSFPLNTSCQIQLHEAFEFKKKSNMTLIDNSFRFSLANISTQPAKQTSLSL